MFIAAASVENPNEEDEEKRYISPGQQRNCTNADVVAIARIPAIITRPDDDASCQTFRFEAAYRARAAPSCRKLETSSANPDHVSKPRAVTKLKNRSTNTFS